MIKKTILKFFKNLNIDIKNTKIYVAYSGGLDSTVLLHILNSLKKINLSAIHIDHNIKNYSKLCVKNCKLLAIREDIKLNVKNIINLDNKINCLESRLRTARYKSIKNIVENNSIVVMAHHEQDLIETYLFRLFKGSGYNGMSSIRPVSHIFGLNCVRPLLIINKKQIYKYAILKKLFWCEDPTNNNNFIARNYIRNKVIKYISLFWPSAIKSISRSIKLVQVQNRIFFLFIKKFLLKIKGNKKNTLDIRYLLNLEINLQILLLRSWININQIVMPTFNQIQHIYKELILSRSDSKSVYYLNNVLLKQHENKIYILKVSKYKKTIFKNILYENYNLDSNNKILTRINDNKREIKILEIKFGVKGCHIKKIVQSRNIPPWERKITPLIFVNKKFIDILHQ